MKSFKQFRQIKEQAYEKYAIFSGQILILGYGSVGQAILPLVLRHLHVDPTSITVLERGESEKLFRERHGKDGVKYVKKTIDHKNYETELAKHVGPGGLIINVSLNIDAHAILEWCLSNGVMQIDTSLERWEHEPDETKPALAERTLYHTHQFMRDSFADTKGKATCLVTHGANPGYVTHLVKRALLKLADSRGKQVETPTDREGWALLMKSLGVKTIHVAERDTQVIDEPKVKEEFVNTWSCEGFWAEGRAPSELGYGTHEEKIEGLTKQGTCAFLNQPGVTVLMKSWVPEGGQYNGFLIQHSESVTISEYFATADGKYNPSVYYVYQPCDAAIASVHEMRGKELDLQKKLRIIKNEIISGMDELGVLLLGDGFAVWHGSQMTIDGARSLIEGENATSVQVSGSLLGGIVWMIKNPKMGYTEPESVPFDEILAIGDQYWEPLEFVESDWHPNQDTNSLFYKPFDKKNPCKLDNYRVWT